MSKTTKLKNSLIEWLMERTTTRIEIWSHRILVGVIGLLAFISLIT